MRVGPAVDFGTGLEADLRGIHFKSHPLASLGKVPQSPAAGAFVFAPINLVSAPVSAMFPRAVIKLQHDLLGRIKRVEVHMREKFHALLDDQGRVGTANDELL